MRIAGKCHTYYRSVTSWYINPDNNINTEKLLLDFQQFFRQNADSWIEKFDYEESGPQLLLQAFLQCVVNGGGYIDREYGKPWEEKLWHRTEQYAGRTITVWGM